MIFKFHFVVVYLICFYMWLHVLTSRKVAIYSDGNNIIIIIIIIIVGFLGFGLALVMLVALVFRWLLSPR